MLRLLTVKVFLRKSGSLLASNLLLHFFRRAFRENASFFPIKNSPLDVMIGQVQGIRNRMHLHTLPQMAQQIEIDTDILPTSLC